MGHLTEHVIAPGILTSRENDNLRKAAHGRQACQGFLRGGESLLVLDQQVVTNALNALPDPALWEPFPDLDDGLCGCNQRFFAFQCLDQWDERTHIG